MPRKRIADPDPAHSPESAAAAPAKAPAGNAQSAKKARAPRASANAVTHRHKITQTIDAPVSPSPAPSAETVFVPASQPMAAVTVAVQSQGTTVLAPTHEEIAFRAFLLAEARYFSNGTPEGDWLEAERQLNAERAIL